MKDRLTRKELAEEKGVAHQRIDTLVREGRLTPDADGLIAREQADEVWSKLDPKGVERELIAKEIASEGAAKAVDHPIVKARTLEAVYRAKRTELAYKTASGEYVPLADIKTEGFEIGRTLQQRLLAFPARLAAELATLAALPAEQIEPEMRKVLQREVRVVISDLIVALDQVQAQKAA